MSLSASCSHLGTSKGLQPQQDGQFFPPAVTRVKCINVLPRFNSKTGYENLHHLVRRANVWLNQHKSWEVRTCESLPYETKEKARVISQAPASQLSTMRRSAPDICFADHITYLRLWVTKRAVPRYMGHRITVYTVLPKPSHAEDGSLQFTNLSSLLEDINSTLLHTWPSNFEILTVETLQSTFDRNEESAESLTTTGLRIFVGFFDVMSRPSSEIESRTVNILVNGIPMPQEFPTVCEKIGLADFAPEVQEDGSLEKFSDLVARASKRCASRSDIRITNIQAVDIRLGSDGFMDTMKTYHYEDSQSMFSRIVRVAFVTRKPSGAHDDLPHVRYNSAWSCRHFYPQMRGLVAKNLETIEQVVSRMNAWLAQHKGEFISAESCLIPVDPCRPWWEEIEKQEIGNMNEQRRRLANWLCVIRLYVTNGIVELRDTEPKEAQSFGLWAIFECFSRLFPKRLFKETCDSCEAVGGGRDIQAVRNGSATQQDDAGVEDGVLKNSNNDRVRTEVDEADN